MKIIFLDVDGVLTSPRCNGFRDFDPYAVGFLRWICSKSDAKIVITSTWRNTKNAKQLFTDIFGHYLCDDWRTIDTDLGIRGEEISEWLERNSNVKTFVILDDDVTDIYTHFPEQLLQTDPSNGMLFGNMVDLRERFLIHGWPEDTRDDNPILKQSYRLTVGYSW